MENQNNNKVGAIIVASVIGLFVLISLIASAVIVNAGERGIVLHFGDVDRVLEEGFHWIVPFVEKVVKMDVKTQKIQSSQSAASKDLQIVTTGIALNYNVKPDKAGNLYQEVKKGYESVIIDPSIQEVVKAASAKYTAEELITERALVREDIKQFITEKLDTYFRVTEVSITDFEFSPEFDQAIEAKVTAEQKALEAKNKLEQIKYEAQQKVETATAEAKKTQLEAQALLINPVLIEKIQAEAMLKAAERWNGVMPVNMYGSAPIPFINVGN